MARISTPGAAGRPVYVPMPATPDPAARLVRARHVCRALIDVVVVGAATRDLTSDDPRGWRLGGAAPYASLTLARLGLRVAALIGADEEAAVRRGARHPPRCRRGASPRAPGPRSRVREPRDAARARAAGRGDRIPFRHPSWGFSVRGPAVRAAGFWPPSRGARRCVGNGRSARPRGSPSAGRACSARSSRMDPCASAREPSPLVSSRGSRRGGP